MISVSLRAFAPILLAVLLLSSAVSLITSSLLLKLTIHDASSAARETVDNVFEEATNTLDVAISQADNVTRQLTQELANATVQQLSSVVSAFILRYNTSTLILQQMIRYYKVDLTTADGLLSALDHVDNLRRVVGDDLIPIASVHAHPEETNLRSPSSAATPWILPTPTVVSRISDDRFKAPVYSYAVVAERRDRMPSWALTSHVTNANPSDIVASIVTLDTFSWKAPASPVDTHCDNATVLALFQMEACGVVTVPSSGAPPFVGLPRTTEVTISPFVHASQVEDEPRGTFTDAHAVIHMTGPLLKQKSDNTPTPASSPTDPFEGLLTLSIRMDVLRENVLDAEQRMLENANQTIAVAPHMPPDSPADFQGSVTSPENVGAGPSTSAPAGGSTRGRRARTIQVDVPGQDGEVSKVTLTPHMFIFDQSGHILASTDNAVEARLASRVPRSPLLKASDADASSKLIAMAFSYLTNDTDGVVRALGSVDTLVDPLGDGDDWYVLVSSVTQASLAGGAPASLVMPGSLHCVILISQNEVLNEMRVRGDALRADLRKNYTDVLELRSRHDDKEASIFRTAVLVQVVVTLLCVGLEVLVVWVIARRLTADTTLMQDALDDVAAMDLDAAEATLTGKTVQSQASYSNFSGEDTVALNSSSALDKFVSRSYVTEVAELQRGMLGMILTLREYRRYLPAWLKDDGGEGNEADDGKDSADGQHLSDSTEKSKPVAATGGRGGGARRRRQDAAAGGGRQVRVAAHLLTETGLTPRKVAGVLIALPFMRGGETDPLDQVMPARPPPASGVIRALNEALALAEPIARQHRVTVSPDVSSSLGAIPCLVVLCNAEIPTARVEASALEMAVAFAQQAVNSEVFAQLGIQPFISVCAGAAGAGPVGTSMNRWYLVVSRVMLRLRALCVYAMAQRLPIVSDEVAFANDLVQSSFQAAAVDVVRIRTSSHAKLNVEIETSPFAPRALMQSGDAVVATLDQPERFMVYAVLGRREADMDEWMYELRNMENTSASASALQVSIAVVKDLQRAQAPSDLAAAAEKVSLLRNCSGDVDAHIAPFLLRLADLVAAGVKGEIELPHSVTISSWTTERVA